MQIKRQNLQKKSYQTVLFCNFQQLKPSYFAYFATINCTAPAVEDHTDSIVLDGRGTSKNTGLSHFTLSHKNACSCSMG